MNPYKTVPNYAEVSVDCVNVMEFVAHFTEGPEPDEAQAQAFLDEHASRIEDAMDAAWKAYVRKRWDWGKP